MEGNLVPIFKDCKGYAKILENMYGLKYETADVTELLEGYLKAKENKDSFFSSLYLSALVLRYWGKIDKYGEEYGYFNFDKVEYYHWLIEAVEFACKYKGWRKRDERTHKKINGNQVMQQCIKTIGLQHLDSMCRKNKSNINPLSLDRTMDTDIKPLSYYMEDYHESPDKTFNAKNEAYYVNKCLKANKYVEGIILDCICTNDCVKTKKIYKTILDEEGKKTKIPTIKANLWPFKIVKLLNDLPKDYENYFLSKYDVDKSVVEKALEVIKAAPNNKKYKYIDGTINVCKRFVD